MQYDSGRSIALGYLRRGSENASAFFAKNRDTEVRYSIEVRLWWWGDIWKALANLFLIKTSEVALRIVFGIQRIFSLNFSTPQRLRYSGLDGNDIATPLFGLFTTYETNSYETSEQLQPSYLSSCCTFFDKLRNASTTSSRTTSRSNAYSHWSWKGVKACRDCTTWKCGASNRSQL